MNVSQNYKLSSVALREINDVCETLEKLWNNFDKLKSPPNFRHLIVEFRPKAADQLSHMRYELSKSLIETDLHYRRANGIAASRKAYIDMLLLEDQSVLQHFDWRPLQDEDETIAPGEALQPTKKGDDETREGISVDTSGFIVSESRDHPWSFLNPPFQQGDLGSLGSDYRIMEEIGRGGMGTVFLAEDKRLLRKVAIKVLHAVNDTNASEAQQRFLREARAMAAIESDHVIPVYQVGDHKGIVYLVMPVLRGETLGSRMLREKTLSQQVSVRITKEIAIGLSHAHELGQIHRDIKPENIWLEEPNSKVKILDFGLVRTEKDTFNTITGTVVGTPRYMSPEQVKGEKVDATTDLFSLGTVLYQMLSGQPAFDGNSLHATLLAVSNCEYQPLSEKSLAIAPSLAAYVDELLSKEAMDRPSTAESVVKTLDSFASSKEQISTSHTAPKTTRDFSGNSRSRIWVGAALFGFLILLSVLVLKFRVNDGTVVVELGGDAAIQQVEIDGNQVNFERNGKKIEFKVNPGTHRLTLKTPSGDVLQTNLTDEKLTVYSGTNNGTIRAWIESVTTDKSDGKAKVTNSGVQNVEQALQLNVLRWILKHEGASASVSLGGGGAVKIESAEEIPSSAFWIYDVNMRGCQFINEELRYLSDITLIRSMEFSDSSLNDTGLASVTKNGQKPLLQLSSFSAYGCDISDRGFDYLKDSPLNYVVIPSTKIKSVAALQNKRITRFHANVSLVRAVKEQCPEVLVGSVVFHESPPEIDLSFITPEMASWFSARAKGERAFEYRRAVLPEENLETWKNLEKTSSAGVTFSFLSDGVGKLATDLGDSNLGSVKWIIFNGNASFSGKVTDLLTHFPNLTGLNFHGTNLRSDAFDKIKEIREQLQLTKINFGSVSGEFNRASAQALANSLPDCQILWKQELLTPSKSKSSRD